MLWTKASSAVAALAVFVPTAAGLPTWGQPDPRAEASLSRLATKMPQSALPAPDGLKLKFVGLGIGTQNYTCNPANPTAEPGTTGAVAKLYDIGTRLNTDPTATWKIGSISGLALSMSSNRQVLEWMLWSQGYQRVLGDHFFTQTVPTFSLNKVQANPYPLAFVKKANATDAPKTACPGTNNEGAVPWLRLIDNGTSQGGINTVYRLETAGGNKPPTCDGQQATFEVPYAAQYWVFGPA